MSDEYARAFSDTATKNSQAAVNTANDTNNRLTARIDALERLVIALQAEVAQMQGKYNLLLTARFNGGSTAE